LVEDGLRSQIIDECVKEAYKRNRPIKIKQFRDLLCKP